jgi:hypothetical protein
LTGLLPEQPGEAGFDVDRSTSGFQDTKVVWRFCVGFAVKPGGLISMGFPLSADFLKSLMREFAVQLPALHWATDVFEATFLA